MFMMYQVCVRMHDTLSVIPLRTRAPLAPTPKEVEKGKPSGRTRSSRFGCNLRGVSRVVCSKLFSAGVDEIISRVFVFRRYFAPGIRYFRKRHGLPQLALGYLCRDKFGSLYHLSWGVLCAVCNAMLCILKKKEQAAGPNSLDATLSLRTRVRAPASVRCSFFFVCLLFFGGGLFSQLFITYCCTGRNLCLFGTARLATTLACPVQGQLCGIFIIIQVGHVPCYHPSSWARAVCSAWSASVSYTHLTLPTKA